MRIGVPREAGVDERRVALVPDVVAELCAQGHEVVLEPGAGTDALIPDAVFCSAGAVLGDPWTADIVVKVAPPMHREIRRLTGRVLIGLLAPRTLPDVADALARARVTAFGLDATGPLAGAGCVDAVASQDRIADYKAALLGVAYCGRAYASLAGVDGASPGVRVLVLGSRAFVDQAAGTSRRLGAQVSTHIARPDHHPSRREELDLERAIRTSDVVISAAVVPGAPAPIIVTAESVRDMNAGSVVVDVAGEAGGNCELSDAGDVVVKHGVTIVAPLNLAASMPRQASALYARNVVALLERLVDDSGGLDVDSDDPVVAAARVTRAGAVVHRAGAGVGVGGG